MKPRSYVKNKSVDSDDSMAWDVVMLCRAYDWPTGLAGGGTIAIVELGGGWNPNDLTKFCTDKSITLPNITNISVDGTQNAPGIDSGSDTEVALDIQVAAASYYAATGKPATIRVYWTQDIVAGVRAASADGCDVCSISWGADEAEWGHDLSVLEDAIAQATMLGMVVFAAAGDNDSSDGGATPANVDGPASCPHAIGCGGTSMTLNHFGQAGPSTEIVWNNNPGETNGSGTGGGFSTVFQLPDWQIHAPNGPGRLVPDVAANADPETGYLIIVDGQTQIVGGTSAVAPLYAGLFAAFGTKLGFVLPQLWLQPMAFNDIETGDNGQYRAGIGPDPCTGLGSPIGSRISKIFVK